MKTNQVQSLTLQGSCYRNGVRMPGCTLIHLSDGSQIYCHEDQSWRDVAIAAGVSCAEFDKQFAISQIRNGYPPKPEAVERYQHNYGFETPAKLGEWEWSSTFGCWGRFVEFADGWKGFTYPENGRAISEELRASALAKLGA